MVKAIIQSFTASPHYIEIKVGLGEPLPGSSDEYRKSADTKWRKLNSDRADVSLEGCFELDELVLSHSMLRYIAFHYGISRTDPKPPLSQKIGESQNG